MKHWHEINRRAKLDEKNGAQLITQWQLGERKSKQIKWKLFILHTKMYSVSENDIKTEKVKSYKSWIFFG